MTAEGRLLFSDLFHTTQQTIHEDHRQLFHVTWTLCFVSAVAVGIVTSGVRRDICDAPLGAHTMLLMRRLISFCVLRIHVCWVSLELE